MGLQIDPKCWTHCAISHSSQSSKTGITKVMVCAILFVYKDPLLMVHIKDILLLVASLPVQYVTYITGCIRLNNSGEICSSVVRAFTHGAMGRRIDPS